MVLETEPGLPHRGSVSLLSEVINIMAAFPWRFTDTPGLDKNSDPAESSQILR